jgi:hypothetical protein
MTNDKNSTIATPAGLLDRAIRAVPVVKYALGILGIVAALSIGKSLVSGTAEMLAGSFAVIALMLVLLFVARVALLPRNQAKTLTQVTGWAVLLLALLCGGLLVTSLFFQYPRSLADILDSTTSTSRRPTADRRAASGVAGRADAEVLDVSAEWPSVYVSDVFDDNRTGWFLGKRAASEWSDSFAQTIERGVYQWEVTAKRPRAAWQTAPVGTVFNFFLSSKVQLGRPSPSAPTSAGVLFGMQNRKSYYAFRISNNGLISVIHDDGSQSEDKVPWTPTAANPLAPVTLAVSASNRLLRFYVDDKLVSEFYEPTFQGGEVGYQVEIWDPTSALFEFDEFELRRSGS